MAYGALGGGTFLTQNKILPGSYINYVSVPRASNLFSDRGYAAIAMPLDWGPDGEIFTIEPADLQTESLETFGYPYIHEKMRPLREIMRGAKVLYLYRLNDNGGKKATGEIALSNGKLSMVAKYEGIIGNDVMVSIDRDIDTEDGFLVTTRCGETIVDEQIVKKVEDLKDNDFVVFKPTGDGLQPAAGVKLTGGENGTMVGESHSNFLEKIEKYDFNAIGYAGEDATIKDLYHAFAKRMRDDEGVKFQLVTQGMEPRKANFEGTINIFNDVLESNSKGNLVYWVTGWEAGVEVNRSLTNKEYDGEYTINTKYKTRDAKEAIKKGYFYFYEKNDEIRVLEDINSFTEFTLYKNEDFSKNQVIRVLDQRAKDISIIFNRRYLGKVQNNEDGRIAFWNELVTHAKTLSNLGAIEDYDPKDTTVEKGFAKDAVVVQDWLLPVMAMQKLYMTIWVR